MATPTRKPRVEYSPALAEEILDHIIDGKTLREIEKIAGMPSKTTILRWRWKQPEFAALYDQVLDIRADDDADRVDELARRVADGVLDPNAARVAIDALKWSSAHRAPRRYGAKVSAELSGRDGGPIEVRDVSPDRLLNLARSMALVLTENDKQLQLTNGAVGGAQ